MGFVPAGLCAALEGASGTPRLLHCLLHHPATAIIVVLCFRAGLWLWLWLCSVLRFRLRFWLGFSSGLGFFCLRFRLWLRLGLLGFWRGSGSRPVPGADAVAQHTVRGLGPGRDRRRPPSHGQRVPRRAHLLGEERHGPRCLRAPQRGEAAVLAPVGAPDRIPRPDPQCVLLGVITLPG